MYGIKKLIDTHQDYFNINSSDLGDYWVCEKRTNKETGEYFYYFLIAPKPCYTDTLYLSSSGKSSYYSSYFFAYSGENTFSFPISFVSDGFYASTDLSDTNTSGLTPSFGYYRDFSKNEGLSIGYTYADIIASNHNIYNARDNSQLVFQLPEVEKTTALAPVIQTEKNKAVLQGVLKEIIQILPLIIVVVVSLVGLRKALKMLSQLLNRS